MFYQIRIATGEVVEGPLPLPARVAGLGDPAIRDLSAALGSDCPDDLQGLGYWPEEWETPTGYDPRAQRVSDEVQLSVMMARRVVTLRPILVAIPQGEVKAGRRAALADRRWRAQISGVAFGGVTIPTDRESLANLTGAALRADLAVRAGETYEVTWKAANGVFVTLTGAEVIQLAQAAEAHVSACYARERVLTASLDAAPDVTAVLAIDLEEGWPE